MKKLSIIVLLFIMGCSPDTYTLNREGVFFIEGQILSPYGSVEVVGDNFIRLHDGAVTSLRQHKNTNQKAEFTMNLLEGEGLRMVLRTVTNEYSAEKGMVLDYTKSGTRIKLPGKAPIIYNNIRCGENKPTLLRIENDGDLIKIMIDCDVVFNNKVSMKATEYIIFESLNKSEIELYGIKIAYIFD